jgi:hypothetical protein
MPDESTEKKRDFETENQVDAATFVARELHSELKARVERLLADPRTPSSFVEKFKQ